MNLHDLASIGNALTTLIAGEGIPAPTHPGDVQGEYNRQRDGVRGKAGDIGFEGDFRPQSVTHTDEFERHDVSALRAKVDAIDLAAVNDLSTAWQTIGDRAKTSLDTFTAAMARATDDSIWRGEARDAVAKGVADYSAGATQLANSAHLTGSKVAELATGLEPTKQLVPHAPDDRSWMNNARHWVAGRGWRSNGEAQDTAKREAVRVLSTVYAPVIRESDTNVPVIPKPEHVVSPPPGPAPGPGPGPTGPGPGPGAVPPGGSQPGEQPAAPDAQTTPAGTGQPDTQGAPKPEAPATNPASTTAASTPSGTPTTPGAPTAPGMPGSPSRGVPAPSPGLPGGMPPQPGQSLPGKPGAPAGPAAAVAGRQAAAARGAMGPGMGPGMAGNKKDDESSKGAPDYLITKEHGEEVTGLDSLTPTVPPVIGE
ncbi:hypothetical protein [Nocardia callitridis]|uniref:Uncharacterized protein n=1 Tax=Nocardia callitridis TaxID=648753 RepID=A0ABP9KIB9_9NOCA